MPASVCFIRQERQEACAPPVAASAAGGGRGSEGPAAAAVTASRSSCGAQRKDDQTETNKDCAANMTSDTLPSSRNVKRRRTAPNEAKTYMFAHLVQRLVQLQHHARARLPRPGRSRRARGSGGGGLGGLQQGRQRPGQSVSQAESDRLDTSVSTNGHS